MAKTNTLCPFTRKACAECALYRGRHYYLNLCKQYEDYGGESKENAKSGVTRPVGSSAIRNWVEPWGSKSRQPQADPEVRLKVIDIESGETRVCEFQETKTWDWSNPKLVRAIGDVQITSWDKLAEILRYKAGKGYQEIDVYEFPRFMLIAGG